MDSRLLLAAQALTEALIEIGTQPVIIGGIAASLLSQTRNTDDVDVIILFDIESVDELLECLGRHEFEPRFGDMAEFAAVSRLVTVVHKPTGRVADVMLGCTPFEEELVQRSSIDHTTDIEIRLPTPEDMVILKALASRPKDLEDIRNLALTYPNMDRNRIERWLREYGELMETPDLWERTEVLLDEKA